MEPSTPHSSKPEFGRSPYIPRHSVLGAQLPLFPHQLYSNYPSSAAAIIFVIFKLNDMISLSEMLLWLSTALRWESPGFFVGCIRPSMVGQLPPVLSLFPGMPVGHKCLLHDQQPRALGSAVSLSLLSLYFPALSGVNALLSFIPMINIFLSSKLTSGSLSYFLDSPWLDFLFSYSALEILPSKHL